MLVARRRAADAAADANEDQERQRHLRDRCNFNGIYSLSFLLVFSSGAENAARVHRKRSDARVFRLEFSFGRESAPKSSPVRLKQGTYARNAAQ
jgi:hypothetical protein